MWKIYWASLLTILTLVSLPLACGNKPTSPAMAPTNTPVPVATKTPTATGTPVNTSTSTPTRTPTSSPTNTNSPTRTSTPTPSGTPTNSPTITLTGTPTDTPTITLTSTITSTPTITLTSTITDTPTITPTITNTGTPTSTGTNTPVNYSVAVTIGSGTLGHPLGVAWATGGNLWISDYGNNNLSEWTTAGAGPITTITTFGGSLTFSNIFQVSIDPATGNLYVVERTNKRIDVFDSTGSYLTNFGSAQFAAGAGPSGVAVNSAGTTVYAADQGNSQCYAWSITPGTPPTYTYQYTFANSVGLVNTQLMHMDGQGNVWLADANTNNVYEFNPGGVYQKSVFFAGTVPTDMAVDPLGYLFVAEDGGNVVAEVNPSGAAVTNYGDGLTAAYGMCFSAAYDYFYVADFGNGRVVGFKKN